MSIPAAVHLAARSIHSIGESLARMEDLVREAARDGQEALGLADVDSLAGAHAFAEAARRGGVRPIFGAELTVLPWGQSRPAAGRTHRVRVLAESTTGWKALVRLATLSRTRATADTRRRVPATPRPPEWITWEELLRAPKGLILLAGGELGSMLSERNFEAVERSMEATTAAFGAGNVFIGLGDAECGEEGGAKGLEAVAGHFGLETVAVHSIRATSPAQELSLRAARQCPAGARTVADLMAEPPGEGFLSRAAFAERFARFPGALEATARIAERCRVELPRAQRSAHVHDFDRGADAESFLWNEAFSRAAATYGELPARYKERLNREYRDIVDAGLANAVVTLWRIGAALDESGVARGPAAGFLTNSLIASLLGISGIDPFALDQPFAIPEGIEASQPALEVQVPAARRGEALEALASRLGAQVCALGSWTTQRAGGIPESLAAGLGIPHREAQKLARSAEFRSAREAHAMAPPGAMPPASALLRDPGTLAVLAAPFAGAPREMQLLDGEYAFSLEPMDGAIPRQSSPAGESAPVAQWDALDVERAGFARLRFATSPMLDLFDEAASIARGPGGRSPLPDAPAVDDAATIRLLREGDTLGVETLESPAARELLRQVQPPDAFALVRLLATGDRGAPPIPELVLAFACLHAKAHAPLAFYAAALSQASHNPRRAQALAIEARQRGIALRPMDINCSGWSWSAEGAGLRPGLRLVRGMTRAAFDEIAEVRAEMAFADLVDVLRRSDSAALTTAQVENLIKAGALDSLGRSRRSLASQLPRLGPLLRPRKRGAEDDPLQFFDREPDWWLQAQEAPAATDAPPDTTHWLLQQERAATGICLAEDPVEFYRPFLKRIGGRRPHELATRHLGRLASLAGTLDSSDSGGVAEVGVQRFDMGGCLVEVRGDLTRRAAELSASGTPTLAVGDLLREGFQWRLRVRAIESLEAACERSGEGGGLELAVGQLPVARLREVLSLLKEFPGDSAVSISNPPAMPERIHAKIAARRVLLCPPLEVALDEQIGPKAWTATGTPAGHAREVALAG